jgi:ATP-dependent DNA ligase
MPCCGRSPCRIRLGIRAEARRLSGDCLQDARPGPILRSRNGKDFSERFWSLIRPLQPLADETIVDGEIVALDDAGRPSFNLLQNSATQENGLVFYLFDLLILAGEDLRNQSLEVRRELLQSRVMSQLAEPIRFSETIEASATDLVRAVREQGLEGVIAKWRDSLYQTGKGSGAWIKMRVNQGQELVIGGYGPAPKNFDSIVVGYYQGKHLLFVAASRSKRLHASVQGGAIQAIPRTRS